MTKVRTERETSDDRGFTLIELIVATAILTLVLSIVGGLIISMIQTDRTVRATTTATTQGQLVTESIERGIRNSVEQGTPARAFAITTLSNSDQLLVARTAGSGATIAWRCTAWYYSASERSIRTRTSTTAIATPSATARANWTLLADGIRPTVAGGKVFDDAASVGRTLGLSFTADAGENPRVSFVTSASSRAGTATGAPACF